MNTELLWNYADVLPVPGQRHHLHGTPAPHTHTHTHTHTYSLTWSAFSSSFPMRHDTQLTSSCYHLFQCHSEEAWLRLLQVDLSGMSALIAGACPITSPSGICGWSAVALTPLPACRCTLTQGRVIPRSGSSSATGATDRLLSCTSPFVSPLPSIEDDVLLALALMPTNTRTPTQGISLICSVGILGPLWPPFNTPRYGHPPPSHVVGLAVPNVCGRCAHTHLPLHQLCLSDTGERACSSTRGWVCRPSCRSSTSPLSSPRPPPCPYWVTYVRRDMPRSPLFSSSRPFAFVSLAPAQVGLALSFFGLGVWFYASKFPEARWPGKFDIWVRLTAPAHSTARSLLAR
jgi:hypothetical protein